MAVAREENMTEAVNVLHVTQPTLSRQIADLERELGVELFERTNRSCMLTGDGMRLRQRAEEILALVEQTESEMSDQELGIAGNMRIGAGERRPCAMGIDHLLQVDASSDIRFVPLEPAIEIASFLVWKKYRLRSRACEELLNRLNR